MSIQMSVKTNDNKNIKLRDWVEFLEGREEHYPISDEFVKDYQQDPSNKNGYVYHAWETGRTISKAAAEPNQKWHYLDAYIGLKIEEREFHEDDDAKYSYANLKCPELILWIAEAVGVDNKKIFASSNKAKELINAGGSRSRVLAASAIKNIITWEEIIGALACQ